MRRSYILWSHRVLSALLMVLVVALALVLLVVSYSVNRPPLRENSSIQSSAAIPSALVLVAEPISHKPALKSAAIPSAPVAEPISHKPALKPPSVTRDQRLRFVAINQTVFCRPSALKLEEDGTLWLDCDEWSLARAEGDFMLALTRERNGWRLERERLVLPKQSEVLVHYFDKYQPARVRATGEPVTAGFPLPPRP